jgi:hypothetical protein
MIVAILTGRMVVAAVLVAAGAAKLADLRSFRGTLVGLGLPFSRVLPPLVAAGELVVGVAGLTSVWPQVTDAVTVVLTLGFVVIAGVALRRSPGLRCRCFGALSNSRFGRTMLARSLVLATVAMAVLLADLARDTAAAWSAPTLAVLLSSVLVFGLAAGQTARAIDVVHEADHTTHDVHHQGEAA